MAAKKSAEANRKDKDGGHDGGDDKGGGEGEQHGGWEGGGGESWGGKRQLAYANEEERLKAFEEGKSTYLKNIDVVKQYLQIVGMFEKKN